MNLLLDPNKWASYDGSVPPIEWNAAAKQYEFLIDSSGASVMVDLLYSNAPAEAGDVLKGIFRIDGINVDTVDDTFFVIEIDGGMVVQSLVQVPFEYEIDLECDGGELYTISLHRSSGGQQRIYSLESVLIPTADPTPDPSGTRRPWWLCVPKAPVEPCPVRPAGFIPFGEYDQDFKYPLASSRVPAKSKRPTDCIACAPSLNPEPETPCPEPVREQIQLCWRPNEGPMYIFPHESLDENMPMILEYKDWNDTLTHAVYIYSQDVGHSQFDYDGVWTSATNAGPGDMSVPMVIYQGDKSFAATGQQGASLTSNETEGWYWAGGYDIDWQAGYDIVTANQTFTAQYDQSQGYTVITPDPRDTLDSDTVYSVMFVQPNDGGVTSVCGMLKFRGNLG